MDIVGPIVLQRNRQRNWSFTHRMGGWNLNISKFEKEWPLPKATVLELHGVFRGYTRVCAMKKHVWVARCLKKSRLWVRNKVWGLWKNMHSCNLTWQWNMDPLKMYFLLKMGMFHWYVSLPEGKGKESGFSWKKPSSVWKIYKERVGSWEGFLFSTK